MRTIRNSLYFLVGFFLMAVAMLATAETCDGTVCTTPPVLTAGWETDHQNSSHSTWATTKKAACDKRVAEAYPGRVCNLGYLTTNGYRISDLAWPNWTQFFEEGMVAPYSMEVCPSGYTRNGGVCTKPDESACQLPANAEIPGLYEFPNPAPSGVTYCLNKCNVYLATEYSTPTKNYGRAYVNGAGGSASTCTVGSSTPAEKSPEPTKESPPCDPGQGVATMGDKVICVDQGQVPTAETPVVKKETKTENGSDGSQRITNTVTTCTGAGSCNTTTSTTIINNAGGTSIFGSGGTSTSSTDSGTAKKPNSSGTGTESETSSFCMENPNLQICKGGMATEDTLKKAQEDINKLVNPTVEDDAAIADKGTFTASEQLTESDATLASYVSGQLVPDGVSSNKSVWESAMSSGWFDEIDRGGCTPISHTFSNGRTWTLDHCDTADKVSQIAGYVLWVLVAWGCFVMLTGGRN